MAALSGSSVPPVNSIELYLTIWNYFQCSSMLFPDPTGDSDCWCEWVRSLLAGLRWLIISIP